MPLHNLLLLDYKMIFPKFNDSKNMYNVLYQLSKKHKRCGLDKI